MRWLTRIFRQFNKQACTDCACDYVMRCQNAWAQALCCASQDLAEGAHAALATRTAHPAASAVDYTSE
jgi:hypothetical protein